jgi:hypothetical protein
MTTRSSIALLALLASACTFDEDVGRTDLVGTIRIPKEAATFNLADSETGEPVEVTDARGLGPVYIGVFPSVQDDLFDYLHPEMGPIVGTDTEGNTYPYGGTTVGHFLPGCYQQLACKMVSGRYTSYDDILGFFADVVQEPISAPDGDEVLGGEEYQERCFDVLEVTSDFEVGIVADETDFVLDGDYYVANTEVLNVDYQEGMQVWGWMDMPSSSFSFATCSVGDGQDFYEYNEQYYWGTNYANVLNFPSQYIDAGDWIASDTPTISSEGQAFEMTLGYQFED